MSCTKDEAFLTRYEKSCKNLARKDCKILSLQDSNKILQENCLATFLQASSYLAKNFIFSARLARLSASLARKILARIGYFLQDGFYWYN